VLQRLPSRPLNAQAACHQGRGKGASNVEARFGQGPGSGGCACQHRMPPRQPYGDGIMPPATSVKRYLGLSETQREGRILSTSVAPRGIQDHHSACSCPGGAEEVWHRGSRWLSRHPTMTSASSPRSAETITEETTQRDMEDPGPGFKARLPLNSLAFASSYCNPCRAQPAGYFASAHGSQNADWCQGGSYQHQGLLLLPGQSERCTLLGELGDGVGSPSSSRARLRSHARLV